MGKSLFAREAFTGFGPSAFGDGLGEPPLGLAASARPGRLRARVRDQAPLTPGVYGMVDPAGELVYVGKAKCLRSRLLSYFRPNSRDPKAGRILEATVLIAWEETSSEFAALLRELELIRRWQPRFNVQGQPRRQRRCYLCLGRKPAPYVFVAARPPASVQAVFGPVPGLARAREAARRVNDWFRLRDCPQAQEMVFADQGELFPMVRAPGCLRHEIGNCLAPCAAACTRDDYRDHVRAALGFLHGQDRSPLEMLERDMQEAATALMFERAAVLRDKLDVLRWLFNHLEHIRQAGRRSALYPVLGHDGQERWYALRHGRVAAVRLWPADEAGRLALAGQVRALYERGDGAAGPPSLEEIDGVLLVAGWLRRNSAERQRLLTPEAALARCEGKAAEAASQTMDVLPAAVETTGGQS